MDDYELDKVLGFGGFGQVRRVVRKRDQLVLVRKEVQYDEDMDLKRRHRVEEEVTMLAKFRHPNIVKYFDYAVDRSEKKLYIYMEYCSKGDLSKVIRQFRTQGTWMDEESIWSMAAQICSAMYYCHTGGGFHPLVPRTDNADYMVVHRDIKPENILIDQNNVIKVSDFGLAKVFTPIREKFLNSRVGTKSYMSPEVMNYRPYSFASDMYSVGCVLYELAALSPPFIGRTSYEIEDKKMAARIPDLPTAMDTKLPLFTRELKTLIWELLNPEPSPRPTAADVLVHKKVLPFLIDDIMNVRHENICEQLAIKEKTLETRQKEFDETVRDFKIKEILSQRRMMKMDEREAKLKKWESDLVARESRLRDAREAVIDARKAGKGSRSLVSKGKGSPIQNAGINT